MASVLMTSTMKSDPGMPLTRASSRGVPVSASAALPEGGSAEGARGGLACATTSAERAGVIAVAAPAATTPVRNLRRSAFGPVSLRGIVFSSSSPAGILIQAGSPHHAPAESGRRSSGQPLAPRAQGVDLFQVFVEALLASLPSPDPAGHPEIRQQARKLHVRDQRVGDGLDDFPIRIGEPAVSLEAHQRAQLVD